MQVRSSSGSRRRTANDPLLRKTLLHVDLGPLGCSAEATSRVPVLTDQTSDNRPKQRPIDRLLVDLGWDTPRAARWAVSWLAWGPWACGLVIVTIFTWWREYSNFAVPIGVIVGLLLWALRRRSIRRFARRLRSHDLCCCLECGYCLQGLEAAGTCPECGCAYELSAVRGRWRRFLRDENLRDDERSDALP